MKKTTNRLVIVLAATLTLSAAQAIAQPQPQQHQNGQQAAASQEFDRQTLEKYAAVSVEVGKVQSEFAQKLQAAPDQGNAMEVQQEATRKTTSIIEDQGLDVPTYNKISQQIKVDPALRQEIEQIRNKS